MDLKKYIDYTNLKPDASKFDIEKLCTEAMERELYSVCINPSYIPFAKKILGKTDNIVKITTVIGFPLGANSTETKVYETKDALNKGADEIDMVMNISALKNKDYDFLKKDIESVKQIAKDNILKVIIETCLLNDDEIIMASRLAEASGANFIKTSTGFSTGGAIIEDVKLMRQSVGQQVGIKASGGIKTKEDAIKMIKSGADRIGTSALIY